MAFWLATRCRGRGRRLAFRCRWSSNNALIIAEEDDRYYYGSDRRSLETKPYKVLFPEKVLKILDKTCFQWEPNRTNQSYTNPQLGCCRLYRET
jgi:hypothetical protein